MTFNHIQLDQSISNDIFKKNINTTHAFKYMRLMCLIYVTLLMAATVSAYRVVEIVNIPEPGSTLIYTFSFFWANVIAEVYGAEISKKLILETVICAYIFALLLTGVNMLPSPSYWNNKKTYNEILGHVLRFTNAGVIGYLSSAFLNVYLINKWKNNMHGKLFWFRNLLASSISEGFATFLAGFITFFGMMGSRQIFLLMLNALVFKLIYGLIAVWPASLAAFVLKKKEGLNY